MNSGSAYNKLLEVARQYDVQLHVCQPNTIVSAGGNAAIQCLANPAGPEIEPIFSDNINKRAAGDGVNRGSMVVKLTHAIPLRQKNVAFLFPGDITAEEERQLLALQRHTLHSDVLLAPHHGSRTSGSMEFLQAVSPSYIVISTGKSVHPQQTEGNLGKFCRLVGASLLTTARDGTLSFTVTDQGLSLQTL